jgi:Domain of unknown function (DUF4145)
LFQLSEVEFDLLHEIFCLDTGAGTGPSAQRFRADHSADIPVLDGLEKRGLLRNEGQRYRVSLMALPELKTDGAEILTDAQKIFDSAQAHYKEHLSEQFFLPQIAAQTNLSLARIRQVLQYMLESPSWSGGRSNSLIEVGAYVCITESAVRFGNFSELIAELRGWRKSNPIYGATGSAIGLSRETAINKTAIKARTQTKSIPSAIASLVAEIDNAVATSLPTLALMGARSVIDQTLTYLTGSDDGFQKNCKKAREQGHLTNSEVKLIDAVFDAGSAAIHRGYQPSEKQLEQVMEVMKHLLQSAFEFADIADQIRAETPPRRKTAKATLP